MQQQASATVSGACARNVRHPVPRWYAAVDVQHENKEPSVWGMSEMGVSKQVDFARKPMIGQRHCPLPSDGPSKSGENTDI
jgi:hypothetical protein